MSKIIDLDLEKLEKLWDAFDEKKKTHSKSDPEYISIRNELMVEYYPFVTKIAESMAIKLRDITDDELASFGTEGLIQAIEKFDRNLGIKFKTYAMYRIRGSMLDNIRKADWVPRLVRRKHSKLNKERMKFESEAGRALSDGEMADRMGITIEEFSKIKKDSTPSSLVSMNSKSKDDQNEEYDSVSNIAVSDDKEPLESILREEMYKKLLGKNFTPLERKIIHMHYYEDLTMKEISKETSFCESRISQMHADIINRLNRKITRNPEYAADLQRMLNI